MKVQLNGEPTDINGSTVADAVANLSRAERGIAVAVNGEVVPRSQWTRKLHEGDRIEVLTATQGG
ncbi:sulfur carrier protein ThiS [Stackebrandtia nassauensis]|uniref:Thiamine biosynthesis protein ThiS n=1 Tax=Stackebrandtia nassauensis (strain DSM 44728 / CIP 108903 / NRRL B-16338 / NBRC 102104 / LLR-40K-21) TaxID=446470 RepID=D3Q915_STANL|nr:sulfur carrier protein ThiS [Stackebrandtia nassauensis]ADD40624.1 thiamine biosynthesis protein ThiS [Stackebrandtia nassauensis DSM 44728]